MPTTHKSSYKIPKWWDCSWRRVPCGKDSCRLCGRVNADRRRHIEAGEDPDDPEVMMDDVGNIFGETLAMVKEGAEKWGIDLSDINAEEEDTDPEPEQFPLYNEVYEWYSQLSRLTRQAETEEDLWVNTEAGQDLLWYKSILLSKVFRQLLNRWEKDRGDELADPDIKYTAGVIKEVLEILKRSLHEISRTQSPQSGGLFLSLVNLCEMEKEIIKITPA